jgi:hypothetical protein
MHFKLNEFFVKSSFLLIVYFFSFVTDSALLSLSTVALGYNLTRWVLFFLSPYFSIDTYQHHRKHS